MSTPQKELTSLAIEKLIASSTTQWIKDRGGLYLIVYPARTIRGMPVPPCKSFAVRYTPRGGKRRLVMLGDFPTTTLADARKQAALFEADAKQGIDRQLALQQIRAETDHAARLKASRVTVRGLFERWKEQELQRNRKDGGDEIERAFEKDVFPFLADFHADEIRRGQIMAVLDTIVARGARRMANRTFTDLRQMFQFALDREAVEIDPTAGLNKKKIGGKETERERILTEAELRELVTQIPKANLTEATVAAIWVMLATLARVSELSKAAWSDVDLEAGLWRIPADNAKNGREHVIYLSPFAIGHFQTLKAEAKFSPWVLPAGSGDGHINTKAIQKQIHDRQRETPLPHRTKAVATLLPAGGPWTAHDLRRSGATLMGELGVRPDVIERCLNHLEQSKMARIYQRQEMKAERAEASRMGDRLALICGAMPAMWCH